MQWIKARNCDIIPAIDKEHSSPSLRCVSCFSVQVFVEMFCAKLVSVDLLGPPIQRKVNSVNIWNLPVD